MYPKNQLIFLKYPKTFPWPPPLLVPGYFTLLLLVYDPFVTAKKNRIDLTAIFTPMNGSALIA